jgi:CHAT domain/AAA ATPase domain
VNLFSLTAVDVAGPYRWRWELRDEAVGELIAEHGVSLDSRADSDQLAAFGDLYEYVRWHADPLWRDDEPRIIRQTGIWARHAVLGDAITDAIAAAVPATVLVSVPAQADQALLWPLELAWADGAPLSAREDVSFVYAMGRSRAVPGDPVGPLRVLAVFSLPTATGAVALRRERHELAELIRRIANRQGTSIELRLLQYGVTRQRLSEVIGSGSGWDVVHLAGHGTRGRFVLEGSDGSIDSVSTADLVSLLRPTQGRLKLATLSACRSAAETAPDMLRLLGLPEKETKPAAVAAVDQATGHFSGLARGLAEELGCAVVATRYPVYDEFSIAFNQVFYDRLLSGGEPAGLASARALAAVLAGVPAGGQVSGGGSATAVADETALLGIPAASVGVFGASAAGLVLRAPPVDPGPGGKGSGPAAGRLAGFPGQPDRFVGRNAIMTAASAAVRADSGTTAILLHGMPGIGKTACLLELAYLCQDQFSAAAFWCPPAGSDPDLVLQSLADTLRKQLGESASGFGLPHRWGRQRWNAYARRLRASMRDGRVLVVIDNLEELLGPDGSWHDPRSETIFDALARHGGASRLVAAGRFAPASFVQAPAQAFLLLPVGPLPWAEGPALARELPALRALMFDGQPPVLSRALRYGAGWKRVRQALVRVQGHPGLLELDDAAVTAPTAPPAQAATLAQAARARAERGIGEWAVATLTVLPFNVQLMAWFVAGLEPDDRRLPVINGTWPALWRRLGRGAAPPGPGPLLGTLSAVTVTGHDDQAGPGALPGHAVLMHPVIAAAIRRETPADVRDAADDELGAYWRQTAGRAGNEADDRFRAALAALPYLARRRDWDGAAALLDDAIRHGARLVGGQDSALPELRQVARFTAGPGAFAALALVTRPADQAEASRLLEESLGRAISASDYPLAWMVAGHLADALRDAGHLDQALAVAARQQHYAQAAGLGPWTELAGQGRRLVILARMRRREQVLAEMAGVRDRMRRLPEENPRGEHPSIVPWAVREPILDTSRDCALAFGKWQVALDIGAEIQDSQRRRGASPRELARARFFDSYPLIRLRRLSEAARLLVDCQQVFGDQGDTGNLSHVFSARADLERALGHPDDAVRFARSALRLTYTRTIPDPIADAHQRLARYLRDAGASPEEQQAHWLAAVLLYRLGTDQAPDFIMLSTPPGLRDGRGQRRQPDIADPHAWSVGEVIETAEQTSGVHLAELITAMEPDAATVARALTAILDSAAQAFVTAAIRAWGSQLFGTFGGYELATAPGTASLVNRFRRWLGSQPDQDQPPEAGVLRARTWRRLEGPQTKAGHGAVSWCASGRWPDGTARFSARSVMATANTPSRNASACWGLSDRAGQPISPVGGESAVQAGHR